MDYAKSSYVNLFKFCSHMSLGLGILLFKFFCLVDFLFGVFLMYSYSMVVGLGTRGLEGFLTSLANLAKLHRATKLFKLFFYENQFLGGAERSEAEL